MASPGEFDRFCVLTLQGGGAVAIDLVGQLQAATGPTKIHKRPTQWHALKPVAIAGTSAGAIIAMLYWAGYSGIAIRDKIPEVFSAEAVNKFFGPPSGKFFNFNKFAIMAGRFQWVAKSLDALDAWSSPAWWQRLCRWSASAGLYVWLALLFLRYGVALAYFYRKRGAFTGDGLVATMDRLLRSAPSLAEYFELHPPKGKLVAFGDLPTSAQFPPLFLVSTDVKASDKVLFSSIDPAQRAIAIAEAVRASAGFPGFFRPRRVTEEWGHLVDGGIISNFPAWIFAQGFRESLIASGQERYVNLAYLPWVHVGLQQEGSNHAYNLARPQLFLRAMYGLLTGRARARLENIAADGGVTKRISVVQPRSEKGPAGVLDFEPLRDRQQIDDAFNRGKSFAESSIRSNLFAMPDSSVVEPVLVDLVQEVEFAFRGFLRSESRIRASVYLLTGGRLKLCYERNMGGDIDGRIGTAVSRDTPIVLTYLHRTPAIVNLQEQLFSFTNPERRLSAGQRVERGVPADRTWMMSVPIVDVLDKWSVKDGQVRSELPESTPRPMTFGYEGPIYGVLSVDGALTYDEVGFPSDPGRQREMTEVRMAFSSLMRAAERCSMHFNEPWL